ncbi:P-loop NTPase fold protein [Streptomyces sp. WMMB 322]|uniref:P-loop NTPase fold protein n=1 Tax=Streptomyces sp. WMMB 322 TaxID=1286821 RepID=UPI0006E28BC7|nr:P-loop NTPase fold protein [Streptomyces sp. WMMB 322]SCK49751.1 KAP family P-loop domain-containing protein [Streptomyces sp. WMMB 322]
MAGFDPQHFSLINDEPVTDAQGDLLGARDPAAQLAKLLVDSRRSTPLTLAVDAGWGTGKSSLMRLVDTELTQVHGVRTVWYNAWTSTGADVLEGLIKSVLMRFDKRVLRRTVPAHLRPRDPPETDPRLVPAGRRPVRAEPHGERAVEGNVREPAGP